MHRGNRLTLGEERTTRGRVFPISAPMPGSSLTRHTSPCFGVSGMSGVSRLFRERGQLSRFDGKCKVGFVVCRRLFRLFPQNSGTLFFGKDAIRGQVELARLFGQGVNEFIQNGFDGLSRPLCHPL